MLVYDLEKKKKHLGFNSLNARFVCGKGFWHADNRFRKGLIKRKQMFEKIDLKAKMSEMPNIDTIMVLSVFEFINTFFKRFHLSFPKDLHRCDWIRRKHDQYHTSQGFLKKKKKHQIKFQVYFSKNNGMTENNNTIDEEARKPTR